MRLKMVIQKFLATMCSGTRAQMELRGAMFHFLSKATLELRSQSLTVL